jgi:hypothetical protein
LSSTTDRSQRGQALAIFSISLVALLSVAALAFDGGMMMLERRDQQNAADAAAIAAARYILTDKPTAIAAAKSVATANGFTNGVNGHQVSVSIPPTSGAFAGNSNYVEVDIRSTRPSIFAGVMGVASWPVGARAVGTDNDAVGGSFSILALDPSMCDALLLSGNGDLNAFGNIQVNSTCHNGALRRQGNGDISVNVPGGACNVVGDIKDGGGQGVINCVQNEGAPIIEDPLRFLGQPAMPLPALTPTQIAGSKPIPDGCPGGSGAGTVALPAVCQFTSSYAGEEWRLYPGLYPGGLKLQGGTFYLEPGIYWLGGGGLDITGTGAAAFSVLTGGTTGPDGGVLFYNSELPTAPAGPIILNGASANIQLYPLDEPTSNYEDILIWQDRAVNVPSIYDVTINGSTSDMVVRGTIYVPSGEVRVNGSSGKLTLDQVIANEFLVNGAPDSDMGVLREKEFIVKLRATGLVE